MKLLTLICIFISLQCFAQPARTILDANTKTPVPFATIKVLHTTRGDVATVNGTFVIAIDPTDSVLISSVGYSSRVIPGHVFGEVILLIPVEALLQPVTVGKTLPARTIIIGNGKDIIEQRLPCRFTSEGAKDGCWPWGPSDRKEEFAEKFTLDSSKSYKLSKLYVPTRKNNNYGPLLLRVYGEDPDTGLPGDALFLKHVVVDRKRIYKDKVVIELDKDQLYIAGRRHIFISIGWPPGQNAKSNFTSLSLFDLGKANTFTRSLLSPTFDWHPFGHIKSKTGEKTTIHTAFALVLEEYNQ